MDRYGASTHAYDSDDYDDYDRSDRSYRSSHVTRGRDTYPSERSGHAHRSGAYDDSDDESDYESRRGHAGGMRAGVGQHPGPRYHSDGTLAAGPHDRSRGDLSDDEHEPGCPNRARPVGRHSGPRYNLDDGTLAEGPYHRSHEPAPARGQLVRRSAARADSSDDESPRGTRAGQGGRRSMVPSTPSRRLPRDLGDDEHEPGCPANRARGSVGQHPGPRYNFDGTLAEGPHGRRGAVSGGRSRYH